MIRTLAAALLLLAFVQPAAAQVAKPDDIPRLFAEAMAANDPVAMAALYAGDAIVMTPEGPVAGGREQITQLFGAMMGQGPFTARFDNVRMDGGDGRGVMVWDWLLVRGAGADESARRVRSMIYVRQQADGWFIQADMYQILSR